jgi:uncharacterized protein (DUF2384 family)
MANPAHSPSSQARKPDPAAVLTKSVLRAAALLGLTNSALALVLGVSEASVSRLAAGTRVIEPHGKEGELALLVVRVYRSLDALVGSDDDARRAWMTGENHALHGKPADLVKTAQGLVSVVAYLDAMRAPA